MFIQQQLIHRILAAHALQSVTNSLFHRNFADLGGGIYTWDGATLDLSNNTFTSNQAIESGGAVYLAKGSTTAVDNCSFSANNATWGGAVLCNRCQLHMSNAAFSGNTAIRKGGGVDVIDQSQVRVSLLTSTCEPCTQNRNSTNICEKSVNTSKFV